MRSVPGIILTSLLVALGSTPAEACGGHRGRCSGSHHQRHAIPVASPTCYAPAYAPAMTYASPQTSVSTASPQMTTAPAAPVATAPTSVTASTLPAYDYAAAGTGQPAYYYTYDNSGKLIVARWMDWVFRGGAAAGQPAPPLPIIGALRGR